MRVDFYNLQKIGFETGFIRLLAKAYEAGNRLHIKVPQGMEASLDKLLWEYDPGSWLPHGQENQDKQPISISTSFNAENGADIIVIVDAGEIPYDAPYSRCLYVFNGRDPIKVEKSRSLYKQALEKKLEIKYHNL